MKTIEPNGREDLVNQYTVTSVEMIQFNFNVVRGLNKEVPNTKTTEYHRIMETYKQCLRFLEKNIKERHLYH